MLEGLKNLDRNYKLRILRSVIQGHISPGQLQEKFNNNQQREIEENKITTITLKERDGNYFDISGEPVSISNDNIKGYYDKLYPEGKWQIVLLHYRNYSILSTDEVIHDPQTSTVTHYYICQSFEFNTIYDLVFTSRARYIDIWGGRARGGSHFGTDYFLFLITQPKYFRGCFLRAIFGDIRGSLWQDFKDRVDKAVEKGDVELKDFAFNESLLTVTYKPTGNSIISKGFKKASGSQSAKLKSLAGMTHVLIEECEEVAEEDFNKLDDSIRTTKVEYIQVIRLFNPPSKNHWLIKRNYNLIPSDHKGWYKAVPKDIPELVAIHSTYVDNIANVNQSTINNYKNYGDKSSPKYNEDFYYRDVLGLVSEGRKGRILTHVKPITNKLFNELPYPSFYGLDWGFNDPNAVAELKYHSGKLFVRQIIYHPGMDNEELMIAMRQRGVLPRHKVYYDSARPDNAKTFKKGIEYGPKKMKGFNMLPSLKGPDSILYGIRELQNIEIYATEDSADLWLEIEEYHWALDADKNPTDEPEDETNHLIDAIRYAYVGQVKKPSTIAVGNNDKAGTSKLDWIEEITVEYISRDELQNDWDQEEE